MGAVPAYSHIVVVIMENHNYSEIAGNAQAPYINSLMAGGANLTNMSGIVHPSQPNYFALYAGSTFGTTDDNQHSEPDPSIYTILQANGFSFQGYVDTAGGGSDFNHDPWVSFPEGYSVQTDFTSFPALFASGNYSSLPSVSFVIPSITNDMHDGTIAQGDAWLQANMSAYAQWAKANNSLLVVTWDESDEASTQTTDQIPTILYGANVVPGNYNTAYNLYNVTSTIMSAFNLTGPNNAATAAPIQVFGATVAPAPTITTPANGSTDTTTTQPVISGGGVTGDIVTVSIDGTAAGTATVANSAWTFTPTIALSNASHTITATQAAAGGASSAAAADTFTVSVLNTQSLIGGSGNDTLLDPNAFQLTASEASIYRLYGAALGREPDVGGFDGWVAALNSGESLAQITTGFINSTEFQTEYGSLNNTQFVTLLYNNVLGRAPDPAGLTNWVNDLNSGATRESVVDGFSESAEYQSDTSTAASAFATTILNAPDYGSIFRLYGATLDRQPDAAGFVSWVDALAGGQSLASVTTSFVNSAEFQTTYGSLDNTQFVTLLYNNVLGRAPDQAGLTNWVNDLNSGATRASVVDGLSESAEYQNDTASSLKTFMATTMAPTWGETLDGAGGANTLLGGPGPDVFVFTQSDAANGVNVNDTVYGLQAWDTLDLAGFGYAKASDAMAHMTQSGNDVIFNAGLANGSNTLIDFHDTTLAALGNASFKFA